MWKHGLTLGTLCAGGRDLTRFKVGRSGYVPFFSRRAVTEPNTTQFQPYHDGFCACMALCMVITRVDIVHKARLDKGTWLNHVSRPAYIFISLYSYGWASDCIFTRAHGEGTVLYCTTLVCDIPLVLHAKNNN